MSLVSCAINAYTHTMLLTQDLQTEIGVAKALKVEV